MATYTHDAVASVGEYKDRNGETKKRYLNVGKCFTNDNGQQSIKFDSVPVGPEWNGWVSLYPAKPREDQGGQAQSRPAPKQAAPVAAAQDGEDCVPF